jgi:hypothetical protein
VMSGLQRDTTLGLRSAEVEAEPTMAGTADAPEAPSTFTQILQDPVRLSGASLTAGFVWWLTRSGGLLTSILMGVPAWRHLDLLPIVARRRDDNDDDDDGSDDDNAPDTRQSSDKTEDFDDSAMLDLFEAKPAPPQVRRPL